MIPSIEDITRECGGVTNALPIATLRSGYKIALYGAGFLGAWTIRWLRRNGVEPIAIADGSPDRVGAIYCGLNVIAPESLVKLEPDLVLITARHAVREIANTLSSHDLRSCSLDAYFVATHFDAFLDVHNNALSDRKSTDTLRAVLSAMLTGACSHLGAVLERDQYFCLPPFSGCMRETYVDAGAYVGDSVERFIWATSGAFKKIYAFEPGERQFSALKRRVLRLNDEWALAPDAISLHRVALSDSRARVSMATPSQDLQSLSIACIDDATGDVTMDSLDAILGDEHITFLKADVEGAELSLLEGAAQTIKRCRPKLAICVYHYPSDIPDITAFIRGLVPEYRFALRHHSPQLLETVLYCWID